ncbi:MAG: rhodanese-like domain-containing protein [Pseudomonadota bacterium]
MKTAKDYMDEANAVVPRLSAEDAVKLVGDGKTTFIDVRDTGSIKESGTIAGAIRLPRGLLEFVADDASPMHNKALTKDGHYALICGAGGQAALAGKTMKEMGFENVVNIGGFNAWKEAGGPTEEG